jgi:hypothetical protein
MPTIEATGKTCPACGAKRRDAERVCSGCNTDLALLVQLENQAFRTYQAGLYLARKEASRDAAIRKLRQALALDPECTAAAIVLGKLLAQTQNYADAIGIWQEALATTSDVEQQETIRKAIDKASQLQRREEEERRRLIQRAQQRRTAMIAVSALALCGLSSLATLLVRGRGTPDRIYVLPNPPPRPPIQGGVASLPPSPAASALALLHTLPGALRQTDGNADLANELQASHVAVSTEDSGKVQLRGDAPTAQAKQFIVGVVKAAVAPKSVNADGIRLVNDYGIYVVNGKDSRHLCDEVIARHFCGSSTRWGAIRQFNTDQATALADPYHLRDGTKIRIPWRLLRPEFRGHRRLAWHPDRTAHATGALPKG